MDTIPHADAGIRTLPAESVPIPATEHFSPMRHASPPELPPEVRLKSYGLLTEPNIKFLVSAENPPAHMLVLTQIIAP